ncbi:MAG TPA: cytochrome c oxidase subunit II [Acidimicrobiales bacterium]|nr:cytochrome c oxidase subunit II [Acidimicrobiales bacterium]
MNNGSEMRRIVTSWVIVSVIGDLLWWFLVGPHIPPGNMTESAHWNQFDFNILAVTALPVVFMVWIWLGYAVVKWRDKPGVPEPVGGAAAQASRGVQTAWITITSVVVISAAIYGTIALIGDHGSGGGEGPNPVWAPAGTIAANNAALAGKATWSPAGSQPLVVQVIAQQWKFTYRYPAFGGMETDRLVLPVNTDVVFDVTSLDVIHDFWAYQLSVKADANPGVNNVAFAETRQTGQFMVRCDELCGIWHGAMINSGRVLTKTGFMTWATKTEAQNAQNTKYLPPFAWTYTPDANGAAGGLYPDGNVTPYSPSEVYGAKQPTK